MFIYNGRNELIKDCVERANHLIVNDVFLDEIRFRSFSMATCTGEQIVDDINNTPNNTPNNLHVRLYKSKNPFTSSLGYYSPSTPNDIFLNSRKLNRSKGSIVSTLIHEWIHYCDDCNTHESYGHGDNSPIGKENTAPFLIDNIAESIVDDKTPNYNDTINSNITYYVPWYNRILRWFR